MAGRSRIGVGIRLSLTRYSLHRDRRRRGHPFSHPLFDSRSIGKNQGSASLFSQTKERWPLSKATTTNNRHQLSTCLFTSLKHMHMYSTCLTMAHTALIHISRKRAMRQGSPGALNVHPENPISPMSQSRHLVIGNHSVIQPFAIEYHLVLGSKDSGASSTRHIFSCRSKRPAAWALV